jgi:NADPH2:quinone reductase
MTVEHRWRDLQGPHMRAARCVQYGPPSALVITDEPDPVPGPDDVVVDVAFAAVNFPDVLFIANKYQVSVPVPFTPGSEFSGTVSAVGANVSTVKTGQAVTGGVMTGAYATKVLVAASAVYPMPAGLDAADAAALWVTDRTAYYALRSVADITLDNAAGQWVVVLGAAGGVGTATIDLAHRMGAKVIAAASSADKLEVCRTLGADATVNYATEDLKNRIKEITGAGADVVIDPVGGAYSEQALRALRWGGRFVTVGFATGEIPRIPLNLVLLKNIVIKGLDIRAFMGNEPEQIARNEVELAALIATGVRPHVSAVYPLSDIVRGLENVASRRTVGKVVIDMGA